MVVFTMMEDLWCKSDQMFSESLICHRVILNHLTKMCVKTKKLSQKNCQNWFPLMAQLRLIVSKRSLTNSTTRKIQSIWRFYDNIKSRIEVGQSISGFKGVNRSRKAALISLTTMHSVLIHRQSARVWLKLQKTSFRGNLTITTS